MVRFSNPFSFFDVFMSSYLNLVVNLVISSSVNFLAVLADFLICYLTFSIVSKVDSESARLLILLFCFFIMSSRNWNPWPYLIMFAPRD